MRPSHAFTAVRTFAHDHDDIAAFHATYIVLTFLIAALFNLGTFLLLVIAHMTLDFVKYREVHGLSLTRTVQGVVRESLLDMFLLLIGLAGAVYLHHTAAVIAFSGMLMAEQSVTRLLSVVIPKMHVLHHILHVFTGLKEHMHSLRENPSRHWTTGEQLLMLGSGFALVAILFAPSLVHMPQDSWLLVLTEQLVPWRF